MRNRNVNLTILGIILICLGIVSNNLSSILLPNENFYNDNETNLKNAGYWIVSPFTIDGNSGWETANSTYDWCNGNGTWNNPYIIENITIDAEHSGNCIEIRNSDVYFIIRNCTLYNAGYTEFDSGIYLIGAKNGLITLNNCSNNLWNGIYVEGNNNTISMNIIMNNGYSGIRSSYGLNNLISKNIAFGNGDNDDMDIYMRYSDDNIISENILSGIFIFVSNNNTYSSNYNDGRVMLSMSNENILWNNTLIGNSRIRLTDDCYINLIYQNYFKDTSSGSDDGMLNKWDNDSLGNYWWDYSGVDADDDGIGDTPYSIGGTAGAVDNYPIWDDGYSGTPILIDDTDPTKDWVWAKSKTWCSGDGTWNNPYIIENITINAEYSGSCIEIRNSDVYFIIRNCTFYNAGIEDTNAGIYLNDVRNGLITLNNCSNNIKHGIYISGRNNTIDGNYVSYNIQFGISIRGDHHRIINNYIVNNLQIALHIYSDYNIIDNNTIKSNGGQGIDVHSCDYNNITNNIIEDNNGYKNTGIHLFMGCNNLILNNTISRHELWGIFLSGSSNYNTIIENRISNISSKGIYLMDNLFNIIFKNSFRMNSPHGCDDGNLNKWDNGTIGNYWDDYTGMDANDDGIGDTPYSIDGTAGAVDNYPIWWDAPIIAINEPHVDDIFEAPPNFDISIVEGIADTTWYTLDNGITNITFSGLSGIINQAEWYNKPNGQISIVFYANDSRGYICSSEVTIIKNVDTPQITIITPITDQLIGNNSPEFELTINDQSSIVSTWYTIDNGLTNYTFIGLTGTINQTAWDNQEDGIITIQFYAEDSIGNIGTYQVIVRKDTENPIWTEPPTDQNSEFGDAFSYILNATDTSGISYWWVNDTINFSIDNTTGIITNITMLDIGIYWLEVRAYDPLGHNCSATFKLIVQDTTAPTWDIAPENQIIELGVSFIYQLYASDLAGISYWELNDTSHFSIDTNGLITNITELEVGVYYLEVRTYDPSGNYAFAYITISVQEPEPDPTPTPTPDLIPSFNPLIIIGIIVCLSGISAIVIKKRISLRTEL